MRTYLTPLLQLQRFFIPGILALLVWAIWRTVFRKDLAVGLVLYLGLVVVVDGYMNTGIFLPGLEKGSIRYSELCAVVLLFIRPSLPYENSLRRTVRCLLSLYFLLLLLSALRSDPITAGIFDFRRLIVPQIIALFIAMRGLRSPDEYRRFFLCLTAFVMIVALFAFWDLFFDRWILKGDMLNYPIYFHNRELGRFGSFFLNPNYLGAFIVLVFPATFIWTLNERKPWPRLYAWAGLLALIFCLVETQSRGPMLAFSITLMLLIFGPTGGISRRRRLGFLVLFVTVFALFMPGFYERATERFSSLDRETTTEQLSRETIWLATVSVIKDNPLFGIGFGEQQYVNVMNDYGFHALDNPHNSYLQMTLYAGIPALIAFLFANGALLARVVRLFLRGETMSNIHTIFGQAVGISGFLASVFTEPSLFTQTVAPFYWVFFGLLLSLATTVSDNTPGAELL